MASIEEVAAGLQAAEALLPITEIAAAAAKVSEAAGAYALILEGSSSDLVAIAQAGTAEVVEDLERATATLNRISEETRTYLSSLGVGGTVGAVSSGATPSGGAGEAADRQIVSSRHETPGGRTPNFRDLNKERPHTVARGPVSVKAAKLAQTDLGIQNLERAAVPDDKVDWGVDFPEYSPTPFDLPRGKSSGRKPDDVPDPDDPREVARFVSLEVAEVKRDEHGYPLNPRGRTGVAGRGILNKWGPNPAADPILTRRNPNTGELEALLIERGDTGEWAIPGGKVDEGESPAQTAGRELGEEAGVQGVKLDFSKGRKVYAGYVDDSRNTDHAWMETTALHLHLDDEQARSVTIEPGSDATNAQWVAVNEGLYDRLFASHGQYLRRAVELL